ncbi:energy-coupling factor ABC transporter ATP-binding protein [Lutimaribacter sp. EGI FJ00015]|uniref:Energy-coupling factor ABC transporter ATP-binding protein n=1 Tax=Lutimaribacter degradans TaxID=2945989 RepID=A0ACC5ZSR3_9RHOB|nr:ABC transporter ATP-binding protein [Lutimaribacter sp. EGI FJ00013]MCM2561132.1 energy-coupling factor ABC transporter ATP-binding protein [Lutimaribacter sp. EGI FJ00013]MCO0611919.1 energy-coupling factor ABC transporter ATP-binding protein [Lutimaribacter sp. EGI FJ00015]MCO0634960.1 energy-coupling factor ABC transporter ATP-binding protein [Lutimaribacter sp. EGI FJ00014]
MSIPDIVIENVSLTLGETRVFNEFSLRMSERRVAVIGRNGAGKSQLARLVAGLLAPDTGRVRVEDIDVGRDRRAALATVGILFQNPDHQIIFPTVEEELAFGLRSQGLDPREAARRVSDMLARFNRADWATRAVHTLSQGQRHLVCLMAVLLMAPRVIVLDEPFAGLDMATALRLTRYLETVDQQLVHITHDLPAVEDYDRAIWLDGGTVRADGPPAQVLPAYRAAMVALGGSDAFTDI